MVAAGAHTQNPALKSDRPDPGMALDKGIFHRDSLAKYAVAFFKMSRSIWASANSFRSRAISICSALTGLAAVSLSFPSRSAFSQLCSVCSAMPNPAKPEPNRLRYNEDRGTADFVRARHGRGFC
jgi:hypothetical protein